MPNEGWIFKDVFDSEEPTMVLDADSMQLLAANPPVAELSGADLGELVGRPIGFLAPRDPHATIDWKRHQLATVRRTDGVDIPVELVVLFMGAVPAPVLVLRILRDLSSKNSSALENRHVALQRSHSELQGAYNRLELLNDELNHRDHELREIYRRLSHASRLAAFGELAAGTTHGINNPLAAAVSACRELDVWLSGLGAGLPTDKPKAACSRMDRALKRIEGIVFDLHRVAKAGARGSDVKQVQLCQEIDLALDLVAHRLGQVTCEVNVGNDLTVRVSPDEFSQVIINLVDNAVTAMEGSGCLLIRAYRDKQEIVIEVKDDGPGMPGEVAERVFEPFYSTKPPDRGSGIGLAVARGIIEGYAGSLKVQSQIGGGTSFHIRLPGVIQ